MLHIHHTKIIHSGAIDWIKSITFKKHNFQVFGTTELVLKDFFEVCHSSRLLVH
jgi:hypothetical protein